MALFTFVNAWWVMLFVALPFATEKNEGSGGIEYAAAPRRVYWRKALIIATVLSFLVTGLLAAVIASQLIPLRDVIG